jgi:hypothetical protein
MLISEAFPSTVAHLGYALLADTDGESWPRDLVSDDGTKYRDWHYFLIEIVTKALGNLALGVGMV